MRIRKLQINNFKGVRSKKTIDFSSSLTILRGPNGFGKTTVFDAIELCLTGSMQRAIAKMNVTKDIKDYNDAFYRNTPNKDVILKLLVENGNGDRKVIVKRLPFDHSGDFGGGNSKKFKVKDSIEFLDTYLISEDDFDNDEFYNIHDPLSPGSDEVQRWLFGDATKLNIKDIYKLFGYIQQEENTFYLKLSESERKSELDFLYNSQDQAEELKILESNIAQLRKIQGSIKNELESLKVVQSVNDESKEFNSVFDFTELRLDTASPFEDDTPKTIEESYESIKDFLSRIHAFVRAFSYSEYQKAVRKQKLIDLSKNNSFQDFFILQDMLDDKKYKDITNRHSLLSSAQSTGLLDYYLLQNFVKDKVYENIRKSSGQHLTVKSYLDKDYVSVELKLEALLKIEDTELVSTEEEAMARDFMTRLKERKKIASELDGLMANLSETRKSLGENFRKINEHHNHKDVSCPFCGNDWSSYDSLITAIADKGKRYRDISSTQAREIEKLTSDIVNGLIAPLEKRFQEYVAKTQQGYDFFRKLSSVRGSVDNEDFQNFSKRIEELVPEAKTLVWNEIKNSTILNENKTTLSEYLEKIAPFDSRVVEKLNELKGYNFESSIRLVGDVLSPSTKWGELADLTRLDVDKDKLQKTLALLASEIELDLEKLGGADRSFFKDIFMNEFKNIEKVRDKLKSKQMYIDYKYTQKKSTLHTLLSSRHKKVSGALKKTEALQKRYKKTLNDYKNSMTESIKIPFHIYSARILQNYSQGYGAFISTPSQNSSSIRFLTGSGSDHDLVHQLSSGQLAVISMAFSLAINKVYGGASLKFLAIDDPVQELDILNVYSFVELLRNDFAGNYQIILSTHDDLQADYISYRFGIIDELVKAINVQDTFFPIKP